MSHDAQSARDDLAFLRAIAGDDEAAHMRVFGETYFAAGLIYGGQMLLHAAQAMGWLPQDQVWGLLIGLGPTALFIPVLAIIIARHRKNAPGGAVSRAIAGAFGAAGIANLFLIAIVGFVAWREHSLQTWLIYPCCVFVLQGMAWQLAFVMRRRTWFALVATGWFVSALAMALSVFDIGYFILFAGLGLWGCMALPGWLMLGNSPAAP